MNVAKLDDTGIDVIVVAKHVYDHDGNDIFHYVFSTVLFFFCFYPISYEFWPTSKRLKDIAKIILLFFSLSLFT
jgi:hypothetical protein